MRIFLSVDIPPKASRILARFAEGFKGCVEGSVTRQYHCTLRFLGDVDEKMIPGIHARLSKIQMHSLRVGFSSLGMFGKELLYAGIDGEDIFFLQEEVDACLDALFGKRDRAYVPHATLVRVKNITDGTLLESQMKLPLPSLYFDIDHFTLYKSTLTSEGSWYEPLYVYPLVQPEKTLQKDYQLPPADD